MFHARSISLAIHLAVGSVLLAMVLRTWLVMGWIEPVTVAGNSMAPTLCGPHRTARCPRCQAVVRVGVEFVPASGAVVCPYCGQKQIKIAARPFQRGDRLWLDRTSLLWNTPRRWEVVVFRCPNDGGQLCVKRIAGLPGETVELVNGDVRVNGRVAVKSLAQQRALRQLVHREDRSQRYWVAEKTNRWQWRDQAWRHAAGDAQAWDWLRYAPANDQPITDDSVYNASLSRRLHVVRDLFLSANLQVRGAGALALEVQDGRQLLHVSMDPTDGTIILSRGQEQLDKVVLAPVQRRRLGPGVLLELSTFDRQLLLALDGQVELCYPLTETGPPPGAIRPFSVGVVGLRVSLSELTLYRDIYYSAHAVGTRGPRTAAWRLGAREYFLVGDNPPISLDSRTWGPVSARWLLGEPLFVR